MQVGFSAPPTFFHPMAPHTLLAVATVRGFSAIASLLTNDPSPANAADSQACQIRLPGLLLAVLYAPGHPSTPLWTKYFSATGRLRLPSRRFSCFMYADKESRGLLCLRLLQVFLCSATCFNCPERCERVPHCSDLLLHSVSRLPHTDAVWSAEHRVLLQESRGEVRPPGHLASRSPTSCAGLGSPIGQGHLRQALEQVFVSSDLAFLRSSRSSLSLADRLRSCPLCHRVAMSTRTMSSGPCSPCPSRPGNSAVACLDRSWRTSGEDQRSGCTSMTRCLCCSTSFDSPTTGTGT